MNKKYLTSPAPSLERRGKYKILPLSFFNRPTEIAGRELLGKFLVKRITSPSLSLNKERNVAAVMITEVEVYDGFKDRGSHVSRGKTERNKIMFGPAGYWYVYFTYGMHWMLNIVTREAGYPAAILIRGGIISDAAGEITSPNLSLERRGIILNGPARLTKFLQISRQFNGKRAARHTGLWIEDRGIKIPAHKIKKGPRVGISYAGKYWAARHWRFWVNPGS